MTPDAKGPAQPSAGQVAGQPAQSHPALVLIDLMHRARLASTAAELRFLAVNDTHRLALYRQSALWFEGMGVQALSGVVQVEANAPYAQWLNLLMRHVSQVHAQPAMLSAADMPPELAQEWANWLPPHACWIPIVAGQQSSAHPAGGLLLVRELTWQPNDLALLSEWMGAWRLAWMVMHPHGAFHWRRWLQRGWKKIWHSTPQQPWYKRRPQQWAIALALVACSPIRLSILAPGELVPANPSVIRSPIEGVVDVFHVQPNQKVSKGQPLFGYDEAVIKAKLDVAMQALATSETEYRQNLQLALSDPKAKSQLLVLQGRIEEKRAETEMLNEQLKRSQVLAPQDGVVIFDDPTEWIGRPLSIGEAIMRVAAVDDMEIEAWVPVADAIPLNPDATATLYLSASPLSPAYGQLRYLSHEAVKRPDGSYAYRLRAQLTESTDHRVGLKGTVRVHGRWVPMIYWALRRPWASIRTFIGW